MTWQSKVASWVIPLLADYAIPDEATVITGVEFGTLDDATGAKVLQGNVLQADYPGLIPDYSLDPEITPTTGGTQYNLKAKKAVGFYGVDCDVLSYNDKRLNKWTFPLTRRNFGYIAMSRYSTVAADFPLHYENQYHFAEAIQALALNYDDDFSVSNLFNSVDKFCLTKVSVFLYPEVVLQVRFLPIWEVWAIRFFQNSQLTCQQKAAGKSPPPGVDDPNQPSGGYYDGYVLLLNPPANFPRYTLRCPGDFDDPEWQYEGFD